MNSMIAWLKVIWHDIFPTQPVFKYDGWIGVDKFCHLVLHALFVTIGLWLGGSAKSVAFFDTLWDLLYEYKDYIKGNGFSIWDFCYGRAGMFIILFSNGSI